MASGVVDVDPAGDVVLVCGQGDNAKRLCVSSGALSLGSPVFKIMLGPNFKEGKKLSEQGTLDLPLPDDDGETMEIICHALHLRHNKLSRHLKVDKLRNVAVLADKYKCTMALGPIAEHWVRELKKFCSNETRANLICCSYLLRLPLMFRELRREHILRCNIKCVADIDGPEQKVVQMILNALVKETGRVHAHVDAIMQNMISQATDAERVDPDNCMRGHKYGTEFIRTLRRHELWPYSVLSKHTLEFTLGSLGRVAWKQDAVNALSCNYKLRPGNQCFCTLTLAHENVFLAEAFKALAETMSESIKKLCLECTLEGSAWQKPDCKHIQTSTALFAL